jgi:CheY-like chemotaxis protein
VDEIATLISLAEDRRDAIPIVAMAAHAMAGDRQRFLAGGMDVTCQRVRSQELLAAIDNVLSLTAVPLPAE